MTLKRIINSLLLPLAAIASFTATAGNITPVEARATANSFFKSHAGVNPGSLKAPAMADIQLAHAEPSGLVPNANVYYVFNVKGGGFIIVAGDDRAYPVLGYSDMGQIDVNNLSEPLQFMLDGYKAQIDYLLTHDIHVTETFNQSFRQPVNIVEPMTKSVWGPEEPYNSQCPLLGKTHSKIGCQGVCMSQMLYFWKFPFSCDSLPAYWAQRLNDYVPALPATTFDYDKMLLSYSHWDFDKGAVVLDTYTDEQLYEVAKLARYCGQAVNMNYSPVLSTPKTNVLAAMKRFGFNSRANRVYRNDYEEDAWEEMVQQELNAGRPIMYIGYGAQAASVGHGFIIDGYNDEHYYHMNMGWYGVNNGWYMLSAISFVNRYNQDIFYQKNISMVLGLEPPLFCKLNATVTAASGLLVLGGELNPQALDINLNMSYRTLPFMFSLTDEQGTEVALSESITLNRLTFENGSDISLALTLPENLPEGAYNLQFNYRADAGEPLTPVVTAVGQLSVVGRMVKYGAPFSIADVVEAVDHILNRDSDSLEVSVADVTYLIDYLLED